jgi:hypothetical protein
MGEVRLVPIHGAVIIYYTPYKEVLGVGLTAQVDQVRAVFTGSD